MGDYPTNALLICVAVALAAGKERQAWIWLAGLVVCVVLRMVMTR